MDAAATPPVTDEVPVEDSTAPLAVVLRAASLLVTSADPETVFESLVHRCAPVVCEAVTATVSRRGGRVYATTWRSGSLSERSKPPTAVVDLDARPVGDHAGYRVRVSFRFGHEVGSGALVAQLLVERAAAVVERERLIEAVAARTASVEGYERALGAERQIGVAVGILMVNHDLTEEQASDLLRRLSERSHRQLHEIALGVARVGGIELPPGVPLTELGTRRRRLASVPSPGHG